MILHRVFERPLQRPIRRWGGGSPFSPLDLFSEGAAGVWYDPSDLTTLYQDTTGLTPAITPGASVGLMLDKRLGQPAPRRNLFIRSGELGNGVWVIAGGGNPVETSLGNDEWRVAWTNGVGNVGHITAYLHQATTYTFSFEYRVNTFGGSSANNFQTVIRDSTTSPESIQNLITLISDGEWHRITHTATFVSTSGGTTQAFFRHTGSGSPAIDFREMQLEYGATRTAYQKIITGTGGAWTPGNHASQATAASRPILGRTVEGGRRNLLETVNTNWNNSGGATITQNYATTPAGWPATRIVEAAGTGNLTFSLVLSNATTYNVRFVFKTNLVTTGSIFRVRDSDNSTVMDFDTGLTDGIPNPSNGPDIDEFNALGDGWYEVIGTVTTGTLVNGAACTFLLSAHEGTGAADISVGELQLEVGAVATPYQHVVTAFDLTEAGKPQLWYLQGDGIDDFMATSSALVMSSDEVDAFTAYARVDTSATADMVLELGTNSETVAGSFGVFMTGTVQSYRSRGSGSVATAVINNSDISPQVIRLRAKIATDTTEGHINGQLVTSSAVDQGTGDYKDVSTLYLLSRAGTSVFSNGRFSGLVLSSALLSTAQAAQLNRFLAYKAGVTL